MQGKRVTSCSYKQPNLQGCGGIIVTVNPEPAELWRKQRQCFRFERLHQQRGV